MQSRTEVYSLPRGRLARWLAEPGQDMPPEIRVALVGTLFGTLPIFFGGVFNTIAVAWALESRHPSLPFRIWLIGEILICAIRLVVLVLSRRRALQHRDTPTDLYLNLAPLWGASVGYGAFISALSGDWVAATLSFLSAAAMVGGICFRNFAAPRLVAVMIVLSLGPCALGSLLSGEKVLWLSLIQIPFYLFAMSVAARRLNAMLISTMKAERENNHRAHHDMLTGLLNRAGLFQAANGKVRTRMRAGMTLFYLDLDGFKPVNDAYGHEAGDMLLAQVAERLRRLAGKDALVARMGGDEFVIVDECDAYGTPRDFARTIALEIAKPIELGGDIVATVGASVGIAPVTARDTDIDTLLRIADAAMYDAKRNNKRGDTETAA
ncbi:diguanylate cyclase [Burkholderia sp. 22PA0099]|uniref:diguanylate cyclase domain-containing protein n=1 Tax=unclassified Burkholderia TaxID=2613784 RepID=UPI0039C4D1DD